MHLLCRNRTFLLFPNTDLIRSWPVGVTKSYESITAYSACHPVLVAKSISNSIAPGIHSPTPPRGRSIQYPFGTLFLHVCQKPSRSQVKKNGKKNKKSIQCIKDQTTNFIMAVYTLYVKGLFRYSQDQNGPNAFYTAFFCISDDQVVLSVIFDLSQGKKHFR